MALPVVAIVGRPNVGKSSLLNALAGRRISIVEPTAGVTRDRVTAVVEFDERYFELVDTGGYGIDDQEDLTDLIKDQIAAALDRADLVIFVVDITDGVTALDQKMAQLLRRRRLKLLLVANKADTPAQENLAGELFRLGCGEPICVSALHRRNRTELLERILEQLVGLDAQPPRDAEMKLAVVGKRNVGKSTFINALAGEQRVIVSEVPGTTRDSIDVRFEINGRHLLAIDTAGLRKKGKMAQQSIEFYSYTRALRSVRRADVVLLFLDAAADISHVDKKLAHYIAEQYKPCIIVVNKWDLAADLAHTDDYGDYITKMLPGLGYAPISFITATEAKNISELLELAHDLYRQASTTVTTSQLNKVLQTITSERAPSSRHKIGLPRIYYAVQVAANPPTLTLFVNRPSALDQNYRRFLVSRLRAMLPFSEVPIRLLLRHHHDNTVTAEFTP